MARLNMQGLFGRGKPGLQGDEFPPDGGEGGELPPVGGEDGGGEGGGGEGGEIITPPIDTGGPPPVPDAPPDLEDPPEEPQPIPQPPTGGEGGEGGEENGDPSSPVYPGTAPSSALVPGTFSLPGMQGFKAQESFNPFSRMGRVRQRQAPATIANESIIDEVFKRRK